jgi:NDP-4-keto-2,6-dideoxyhexose 3-C-methyltransferase
LIKSCRNCKSEDIKIFLSLGNQYLSDFRSDDSKPDKFPLDLLYCKSCTGVQLSETVPRQLLYHDNYGYESGINEIIVKNLKGIVELGYQYVINPESWLDIACNDGTLLSMVKRSVNRVGVDPVTKFVAKSNKFADLIINDFFPTKQLESFEKFDVITSISMFYDIEYPQDFLKQIKNLLSRNGVWIVQQNYLISMVENNSFDNICHEHIHYHSLSSMEKILMDQNLEVIDAYEDEINGGSLVTVIGHKNRGTIPKSSVEAIRVKENLFGINDIDNFFSFADKIQLVINNIKQFVYNEKANKKSIFIYGASTRSSTIWQACQIDQNVVDFAVERQIGKLDKYYSPVGMKIISEEQMRKLNPDYLLIGPWFLAESFIKRERDYVTKGGKLIIPLPELRIIENSR